MLGKADIKVVHFNGTQKPCRQLKLFVKAIFPETDGRICHNNTHLISTQGDDV
jgi:hypothetical protein